MTRRQLLVAELQAEALGFRSAAHGRKWASNQFTNPRRALACASLLPQNQQKKPPGRRRWKKQEKNNER